MRRIHGFTLIEVMVAMLLLLSAIALTSAVYSNAVSATLKAERSLMLSQYLPMILAETRRQVRDTQSADNSDGQPQKGGGTIRGIEFTWTATELKRGAPPARFDAEAREFVRYGEKFTLHEVELTLKHQQREQMVTFKEVTW